MNDEKCRWEYHAKNWSKFRDKNWLFSLNSCQNDDDKTRITFVQQNLSWIDCTQCQNLRQNKQSKVHDNIVDFEKILSFEHNRNSKSLFDISNFIEQINDLLTMLNKLSTNRFNRLVQFFIRNWRNRRKHSNEWFYEWKNNERQHWKTTSLQEKDRFFFDFMQSSFEFVSRAREFHDRIRNR